jgi:hypothetical protein
VIRIKFFDPKRREPQRTQRYTEEELLSLQLSTPTPSFIVYSKPSSSSISDGINAGLIPAGLGFTGSGY